MATKRTLGTGIHRPPTVKASATVFLEASRGEPERVTFAVDDELEPRREVVCERGRRHERGQFCVRASKSLELSY